jgi:hypothetical protein
MKTKMTYVIPCLLLACVFLSCTSPVYGDDVDKTGWVLKTEEDAAVRALVYFPDSGVSTVNDIMNTAKQVTIQNSMIPFLSDSVNNRVFWEIAVTVKIVLVTKGPSDPNDDMKRTFKVVIDPGTGRLVSASCVLADDYPGKKERLSADVIKNKLEQIKLIIHDFPAEDPGIDFIEALNFVMGSPYRAREIYVWYVDFSRYNYKEERFEDPHPVWWIDLRGIPPIDPEGLGTTMRSVIDARTGIHILSTNMDMGGY